MTHPYKNKNILITGGCGFIGSRLAIKLIGLGASVTILDNLSTGHLENIISIQETINLIKGDITDFNTCLEATKNTMIVFHLAALTSVSNSMFNPHQYYLTNTLGTINILQASYQSGVERFIFSSSAAVYGGQEGLCHEKMVPNPSSVYGGSKLLGELSCQQYSNFYHIKTVALRYFNVYAPNQVIYNNTSIANYLLEQIKNNQPITIFGDGHQTRDFIPVEQVVNANCIVGLYSMNNEHETINIATGKSMSILSLFENIKKSFPLFNQPINFLPARVGDVRNSQADCAYYNKLKDLYAHIYNSL